MENLTFMEMLVNTLERWVEVKGSAATFETLITLLNDRGEVNTVGRPYIPKLK